MVPPVPSPLPIGPRTRHDTKEIYGAPSLYEDKAAAAVSRGEGPGRCPAAVAAAMVPSIFRSGVGRLRHCEQTCVSD